MRSNMELSPEERDRIHQFASPSSPWRNPPNFASGSFESGHGTLKTDSAPYAISPERGASACRCRPEIGTKTEKQAGECGFSTPAAFRRQLTFAESSSD